MGYIGKIIACICWGASLRLFEVPFDDIVWFVLAAIALTAAIHVAVNRARDFVRGELGLPMIGLVLIGLVRGARLAGMPWQL